MLRGIGSAGEGLYLERNVRLLRHPQNVDLGSWVIVKEGARLCPANRQARIRIGDWTTIGYHTYVFATAGVEIGANCLIAPFCYLVDSNHGVRRDQLIREQPMSASPIVIEEDVWLGAGVTVLKGVKIGRGAVVGAGSVVSTDVPAYAIASGNPLQITGERRFKDAIIDVES
ncbi:MAG: acyltransferase [Verrucomicrobiales bacterium]|nr:acyltransferase [Verrucomicrobiales bacterium]